MIVIGRRIGMSRSVSSARRVAGARWLVRLTDGPQLVLVLAALVLTSINLAGPSSRVQVWAVAAALACGVLAIIRSVVLRPYLAVLYERGVFRPEFKGLRLFGMAWLLIFAGIGGTYAATDLGASMFAPDTVTAVVGSCQIETSRVNEESSGRYCYGTWSVDGRSYQGRLPTVAPKGATVTVRINRDHPETAHGDGSVVRGGAGVLFALASLALWVRLWGSRVLTLRRVGLVRAGILQRGKR